MEEGVDYEWANAPGYSDYQVAGKPLHAVLKSTSTSLCGIKRQKWSGDLFNMDRCKRCAKALGLHWWHDGHTYRENPYDRKAP